MVRTASGVLAMLLTAAVVTVPAAQKTTDIHPGKGGSPHVKTEWSIDKANIAIQYGRPYLKGRPESQLMPHGKPWRTGADEATVLTTDRPLTFGTVKLEPGSYTINTQPGEKEWELIFGKVGKPGQWGVPYQPGLEIGRVPMKVTKTSKPVEQLTIHVDDTAQGGTLRIEWGTTSASAPFTVG
jgi:hypothetical protein